MTLPARPRFWLSVMAIDRLGRVLVTPCNHPEQIPGLDATGCGRCRIWWFDNRYIPEPTKEESKAATKEEKKKLKPASW